jgi:magnesium chelatase subunit I
VSEVVEQIAFAAREDKRVDKRSGVSQRLAISCLENVVSNAERRAIRNGETTVVPRIADIYAAMPAITGKLELEYEGELRGADAVVRDLIRTAVAKAFDERFPGANLQQVVQWFDMGGEIRVADTASSADVLAGLENIQGLLDRVQDIGVTGKGPELRVSAAEFILEGLHAHKKIGRNEERLFTAGEKQPARPEKRVDREEMPARPRRPYN